MTNSNDTITISTINGSSLPAFNSETLSTYLGSGGGSNMGSYGMSSSMCAGDTITISNSNYSSAYNGTVPLGQIRYDISSNTNFVYTGTGIANGWQTISNQFYGEEFKDRFPEWNAFRKLCGEYPGLEKAYERMKLCYTMCYADSLLPKEDNE